MWNSLMWIVHAVILMMVSTGQTEDDTGNELSEHLNDYVIAVNDVNLAAENALENMPRISQMYDVENSPQLSIVEKAVKSSLLNKLVQQLLEIWVQIQVLKLGGYPVLQSLLEKAKELFQKIKELGGENIVTSKDFLDKLWDKVREILDLSRKVMCDRNGKFTGSFAWEHYQNITKGLDILVIKEKLLKKLDELDLQSVTFVRSNTTEHHTNGDYISRWAYFVVKQLIKSITNPMGKLQTIVLKNTICSTEEAKKMDEEYITLQPSLTMNNTPNT
ncbi:uncharacterized protein LOC106478327 isoform X2 [Limulus polyphemus]|uniref:Uncharacterized protein LOC106478327 isoform X2 n=1 Tax=Limulus polyphemus TaxID=6850 RepID=A0ABM1S1X8_LIMPO|nr:uncharacterized protein LOC106478327 isoform X2 [Limulus polyphemus]